MKPHLLVILLAAAAFVAHAQQSTFEPEAAPAGAQAEVKYTLLKPDDKTSETVKDGERNPYGKSDSELVAGEQKGTNEENQIRDLLARLRVVGASPGPKGLRVMLGDMVLEEGSFVPQVLPEQTVVLRTGRITQQAIELIWVEKKPSGLPARTLTIPVDLRPYVRCALPGQASDKNQWEKEHGSASQAAVTVLYPEVAQSAGTSTSQVAQNTTAPRAVPVEEQTDSPRAEIPAADAGKPALKPDPQWEKAMDLLDKILPKGRKAP